MNLRVKKDKEIRKDKVLKKAIEIFKEKGIENTKMTDIAIKAKVGVASVYRYFNTKQDLVIAAGTMIWSDELQDIYVEFKKDAFINLNGFNKVKFILQQFKVIYNEYQEFLRFIDEFDSYILKEKIEAQNLHSYEQAINDLSPILIQALEKGKEDGTIRKEVNSVEFYMTITHSLISLSQKLLLRGSILDSDNKVSEEKQIQLLIDMAMMYTRRIK